MAPPRQAAPSPRHYPPETAMDMRKEGSERAREETNTARRVDDGRKLPLAAQAPTEYGSGFQMRVGAKQMKASRQEGVEGEVGETSPQRSSGREDYPGSRSDTSPPMDLDQSPNCSVDEIIIQNAVGPDSQGTRQMNEFSVAEKEGSLAFNEADKADPGLVSVNPCPPEEEMGLYDPPPRATTESGYYRREADREYGGRDLMPMEGSSRSPVFNQRCYSERPWHSLGDGDEADYSNGDRPTNDKDSYRDSYQRISNEFVRNSVPHSRNHAAHLYNSSYSIADSYHEPSIAYSDPRTSRYSSRTLLTGPRVEPLDTDRSVIYDSPDFNRDSYLKVDQNSSTSQRHNQPSFSRERSLEAPHTNAGRFHLEHDLPHDIASSTRYNQPDFVRDRSHNASRFDDRYGAYHRPRSVGGVFADSPRVSQLEDQGVVARGSVVGGARPWHRFREVDVCDESERHLLSPRKAGCSDEEGLPRKRRLVYHKLQGAPGGQTKLSFA